LTGAPVLVAAWPRCAVSQNCILLAVRTLEAVEGIRCPADYKSAIQQIENLRYFVIGPALLQKIE
jgi:hypothetical protein